MFVEAVVGRWDKRPVATATLIVMCDYYSPSRFRSLIADQHMLYGRIGISGKKKARSGEAATTNNLR